MPSPSPRHSGRRARLPPRPRQNDRKARVPRQRVPGGAAPRLLRGSNRPDPAARARLHSRRPRAPGGGAPGRARATGEPADCQRTSIRPELWRTSSAATARLGTASGSRSITTRTPCSDARSAAPITRRSLKRCALRLISSPAAAAVRASSSAPRIAPSLRNRASMEPKPGPPAGGGCGSRSSPVDQAAIWSSLAAMSRAGPPLISTARSLAAPAGSKLIQPPAPSSATMS